MESAKPGERAPNEPGKAAVPRTGLRRTRVRGLERLNDKALLLSFDGVGAFESGALVGLSTGPERPLRWYSLASAPDAGTAQAVFDVVEGGELTPFLAALGPGDELWATAPSGEFRDAPGKAYWLAAGTGIAPFRSMVLAGKGAGKTLVHGARRREDFLFAADFEAAARDSGLRYIRCASADAGEGLHPGRLTGYLAQAADLDLSAACLVCGGADFVVDVRDVLLSRGFSFSSILSETYF